MQKISVGNFDMLIGELAAAFNDMAKKLGDTETMRLTFIFNVSHEIQSPLTSISGFAALLKTDTLIAEQRKHYLNIIEGDQPGGELCGYRRADTGLPDYRHLLFRPVREKPITLQSAKNSP